MREGDRIMSFTIPNSLFGTLVLFALGLGFICIAGDKFVDASVAIATRLRIPQIVVGATIVSLGTTLPEILVSTSAALGAAASPEICIGNALGSIICNTALIAGLGQLLRPTQRVKQSSITWRLLFFLGAILGMFGVAFLNGRTLPRWFGILLLLAFVAYALLSIKLSDRSDAEPVESLDDVMHIWKAFLILAVSAFLLYVGANLLVDNGQILARMAGVPERVIAVTIIALGTSLPELVTTVTSCLKGQGDVGLGNIIGANLFNLLLVVGLPTAIKGSIAVTGNALFIDLPIALLVMLGLILPMLVRKKGSRLQGGVLVAVYVGYCLFSFLTDISL